MKIDEGFEKAQSDNLPVLDIFMVAAYLGNNPLYVSAEIRGVKANASGRSSYGDAAVGYVQLKRERSQCTVKAQIRPEQRVRNKDYNVTLVIDEAKAKVLEAKCLDCAASSGGCKHAIAFIMWVHRRSEEPSVTEVECYWRKSKLSCVGTSLKFLTLKDFKELPPPTLPIPSNGQFFLKFIEEGQRKNISSQIVKHFSEENPMNKLGLHYLLVQFSKTTGQTADEFLTFAQSQMTLDDCTNACLATKEQSEDKMWHNLRYGRVTASKIHEVSRCNTSSGVLVEQILGSLKVPETAAVLRGKLLEKSVLLAVEKKRNVKFHSTGLLLSPEKPFLGASPDGINDEYVVEIKCPKSSKRREAYIKKEKITDKFKAQIHLQMYMFGKQKGLFCVADPGFEINNNVDILDVAFDERYIKAVIIKAGKFWKNIIFPALLKSIKGE